MYFVKSKVLTWYPQVPSQHSIPSLEMHILHSNDPSRYHIVDLYHDQHPVAFPYYYCSLYLIYEKVRQDIVFKHKSKRLWKIGNDSRVVPTIYTT